MDAREVLFAAVYPVVLTRIETGAKLTGELLRASTKSIAETVMMLYPDLVMGDDVIDAVAKRIEELNDIVLSESAFVQKDSVPWLDRRRKDIDPFYWERYRTWLGQEGLPPAVVAEIGAGTDRVLDLLRDPTDESPWDRRGLVVGNVQSGKTAHYAGLVCKAADAGFRAIIIIAGVHNNLRNQTQGRIDAGFIGEHRVREGASVRREHIGVGRINPGRRPVGFTSSNHDFSKAIAKAMGVPFSALVEPAVFVIKKNPTTLKNLIDWLKPPGKDEKIQSPLLLIDDEADNASINVAYSKDQISMINGLIRDLLTMFSRSAYVGYTATPFANILIEPRSGEHEDLFPRSFIVSLEAPNNYLGAKRIFLDDPLAFLRYIDDAEDVLPTNHKIDHLLHQIPESMIDSTRAFVLARAIRIIRGDGHKHTSMLINASRFVAVQKAIGQQVYLHLEVMRDAARLNHALPPAQASLDPEIASLKHVFDAEYAHADVSWADVLAQLWAACAPITVVEVNSESPGTLDYSAHPDGLHVIAVGGLALSRGLTLEGLSTTYFLRSSQMYDTLLQMGRWFGYRPRYEDLCRIWIPEEAAGWYAHIAESVDELREDLRTMAADGRSPEEFGLKVRAHPANLIVTARNRMGAGETRTLHIGLGGRSVQTTVLGEDDRLKNLEAGATLLSTIDSDCKQLGTFEEVAGGLLLCGVPVSHVREFLTNFSNNSISMLTDPKAILEYIDGRPDEMEAWDLFIAQLKEVGHGGTSDALGIPLRIRTRSVNREHRRMQFRKSNFLDPGDEKAGLTDEQISVAEEIYRENNPPVEGKYNYSALTYRMQRQRPQLGLHLLNLRTNDESPVPLQPWLAWNISFPPTAHENQTTKYVVNAIWAADFAIDSDSTDGDPQDD
jgi:hypothetical protein